MGALLTITDLLVCQVRKIGYSMLGVSSWWAAPGITLYSFRVQRTSVNLR